MTDPATILNCFELGFVLAVPAGTILHTWTESARPHGVSLTDCAECVCRSFAIYTLALSLLYGIAWLLLRYKYAPQLSALSPIAAFWLARIAILLGYLAAWYYGAQSAYAHEVPEMPGEDGYIRGTLLIDGSTTQQRHTDWRGSLKTGRVPSAVRLAGVYMPPEAETYHILAAGASGAGKSIAIQGLLSDVAERAQHSGERALILDPDGNYLAKYYDKERGDTIWNPFDERSVRLGL